MNKTITVYWVFRGKVDRGYGLILDGSAFRIIGAADAFFTEFSAKGAHIRSTPQNFEWAYEFEIEDTDGHVLRIGSELQIPVSLLARADEVID